VFEAATAADLIAPTKDFIVEVAELALPDMQIVFRSKEMPPQEDLIND